MNINFQAVAEHCIDIVKNQYFCFDGRVGFKSYWTYMIPVLIISCLPFIGQFIAIVLLCPTLGMNARRLHDTGKSGWFQLIMLIPVIGLLAVLWLCMQNADPADNQYGTANNDK